jgi:hypothetical protein
VSQTALDAFRGAQSALDLALDGTDTRAIEVACERFRAAIFDVRAVGAWRTDPGLARRAADMLGRVELAQQRVKNLTRDTRERIAALEAARGTMGLRLYDRSGSAAR